MEDKKLKDIHVSHYLYRDIMTGVAWLGIDIGSYCGQKQTDYTEIRSFKVTGGMVNTP